MKRVAAILLGIAVVFGVKFYNKSSDAKEVRTHLESLCSGDGACVAAVRTHFDSCFESAFTMGGRRTSSRLEGDKLIECINRSGGKEYFAFSDKKE